MTNLQPNETIKMIFKILDQYGFGEDWYVFNPTIARSFAYSDGPIWEIEIPEYTAGSVLGGERFDKLTYKLSGKDIPGTGFGLGFDRTLEAMEELGLFPVKKTVTQVLVTVFSPALLSKSIEVSYFLRSKNINTDLYPDETTKLEKQLKYADQKGIPFVIIVGPDETAKGQVTLKNLNNNTQKTVGLDEVVQKLT